MKIRYLILAFVFAIATYAGDFKREEVAGLRLSLVDEKKVEHYSFGQNGVVLAEFGRKDGPITAPALYWKIEAGQLLITDDQGVIERFELVDRSEKIMKLRRRSGEIVTFEVATKNG